LSSSSLLPLGALLKLSESRVTTFPAGKTPERQSNKNVTVRAAAAATHQPRRLSSKTRQIYDQLR
jgi:hypothetical protein